MAPEPSQIKRLASSEFPNVRRRIRTQTCVKYSQNYVTCDKSFFILNEKVNTQLAFFINLQRAVIGPSATLTDR